MTDEMLPERLRNKGLEFTADIPKGTKRTIKLSETQITALEQNLKRVIDETDPEKEDA